MKTTRGQLMIIGALIQIVPAFALGVLAHRALLFPLAELGFIYLSTVLGTLIARTIAQAIVVLLLTHGLPALFVGWSTASLLYGLAFAALSVATATVSGIAALAAYHEEGIEP